MSPDGRNPVIRTVWVIETGGEPPGSSRHIRYREGDHHAGERPGCIDQRRIGSRLTSGRYRNIVLVHREGAGYEVEFSTLAGRTLAVVTVRAGDVRPVGEREIAHARQVA